MADWVSIKAEYIATGISTRSLAEKSGVSYASLRRRAEKEHWADERKKTERKVSAGVAQKVARVKVVHEADRITRILALSDTLIKKAERAASELDKHLVTNKKRERTITYGDPNAYGKPTKEIIDDTEIIDVVDAPIDRQGLKMITSALKDLNEIAKVATGTGGEIEDLAPLAMLLNGDDSDDTENS